MQLNCPCRKSPAQLRLEGVFPESPKLLSSLLRSILEQDILHSGGNLMMKPEPLKLKQLGLKA